MSGREYQPTVSSQALDARHGLLLVGSRQVQEVERIQLRDDLEGHAGQLLGLQD